MASVGGVVDPALSAPLGVGGGANPAALADAFESGRALGFAEGVADVLARRAAYESRRDWARVERLAEARKPRAAETAA